MKLLTKIYFRSFLLQAVWNYESMQGIGFLFSILPKLKSLYGQDTGKLKESCRRHIGYFNTHPYMVSIILGFAAKQEEKIKEGESNAIPDLDRYKLQMAGPLAATGDKYFWSTYRPLMGLIGVLLFLVGTRPYYLIPVIFILLYNVPVIRHRYKMLLCAYTEKSNIAEVVKKAYKNFVLNFLSVIGLLIIAACLITAFVRWGSLRGGLLVGFTAGVVVLKKYWKVSETKLLYIIVLLVIIGNLIF